MVQLGAKGSSESLIVARDLAKTYTRGNEELQVLQGIDLDVDKGDAFLTDDGGVYCNDHYTPDND